MKIRINWENAKNMCFLPEIIVTKYLNNIDGDTLKVILYIFCNKNFQIKDSDIALKLNMDKALVCDILRFWHNESLIVLDDEQVNKVFKKNIEKDLLLTKDEYSDIALNDQNVKFLLRQLEFVLKRNMVYSECQVFTSLYKMYGMPIDVILMITQYCKNCGKDSVAYIKKVAINWLNLEIDTLEKVENYIIQLEKTDKNEKYIKSVFGITSRNLTKKEKEMAFKWVNDFNVNDDILQEAYNRCVDNIGKISFHYINKILTSWNEKGYNTLDTVLLYEKNRSENVYNKNKYNSDIEQFDKEIKSIYDEV